jgi:alkaline phosphatase D
LDPATAYEWKFEGDTGSNVFKTNPNQNTSNKFSFYFGSCFLNNFPNFQQAPGFGYVADLKPDLFFFIGDFIYSDIPFFRGDDASYYYTLYRNSMKNPPLQKLFQTTPNYHMWDDHEVRYYDMYFF